MQNSYFATSQLVTMYQNARDMYRNSNRKQSSTCSSSLSRRRTPPMMMDDRRRHISHSFFIILFTLFCNVSVEASLGYFWQITDLHLELNYSASGSRDKMCWRQNGPLYRSSEGRYGGYGCDSPFILVESAIKAMKEIRGNDIEFILWTGDSISHAIHHEESLKDDTVYSILHNITSLLRTQFPFSNIYPVLGNMDWYPKNKMSTQVSMGEFKRRLQLYGKLWDTWVPPESLDSFNQGGYYAIEQKNRKLRLLILNTSLYTKKFWLSGIDENDPAGQFEWLTKMLDKAKAMGETVFIIGHIPPGKMERYMSSRFGYHAYADQFNKRYLRLVRDYHDVIAGQFFGHFHSDSFRIFYEKLDKTKGKFLERDPISYLFIAPAVSPRKSMFADEIGPNNPGLRLYQFNTTTGQIYDYSQYYLNLSEANTRDKAEWKILYNLTNYYHLNNVSAASLSDLAFTFLKESGTDMFFKYYHANSVGYEDPRNCKDLCRRTHFCVITNVDYQDYERCIQTVFGPSSSAARLAFQTTPITSALPLTLPILLLYSSQLNNIFRWWSSSLPRLSSLPLHL